MPPAHRRRTTSFELILAHRHVILVTLITSTVGTSFELLILDYRPIAFHMFGIHRFITRSIVGINAFMFRILTRGASQLHTFIINAAQYAPDVLAPLANNPHPNVTWEEVDTHPEDWH